MGYDIALIETGDGGDVTVNGNDLAVIYFDENDLYLRMFGGNREGDSKRTRKTGEEDKGYWANGVLFGNDPAISFNSLTERALDEFALNSEGRVGIQNAITKDLQGLNVTVTVQIVSVDRISVRLDHIVTNKHIIFSLVRSTRDGDWNLNDFNPLDFF